MTNAFVRPDLQARSEWSAPHPRTEGISWQGTAAPAECEPGRRRCGVVVWVLLVLVRPVWSLPLGRVEERFDRIEPIVHLRGEFVKPQFDQILEVSDLLLEG